MKVNGLRADDLAGTGLVTRQRWAVPLWLGVLLAVAAALSRQGRRLVVSASRAWRGTVPVGLLLLAYARHGEVGVAVLVLVGFVAATVWHVVSPASYAWHVTQRVRGACRWHTRYRRLWLPAMEGVGLTRITRDRVLFVPRVLAVHSTRVVDVLDLRLLHGHTPDQIMAAAEGLRHVFEAHRCTVVETRPGHVRLTFYARDPLTTTLPPFPPAPGALVDLHALPVALAEDGTVYRLRLHDRHVLVVGASGAGKASVFWSILNALAPLVRTETVVLHGIDPKRMELVFAPELFARLTTGTPAEAADHLEALVLEMGRRQDRMTGKLRAHTATPFDPALLLVIDELASLTAYCTDRDAKKRIEAALSLLLTQGRAVGIYVLAAIQDPRKDVVTFRDLFTVRIVLRVTEAGQVDMTLGDGALDRGAAAHRIPDHLPGVGYVLVEGASEPVRVRFTYLDDPDIRALAASHTPGTLDSASMDLGQETDELVPAGVVDLTTPATNGVAEIGGAS